MVVGQTISSILFGVVSVFDWILEIPISVCCKRCDGGAQNEACPLASRRFAGWSDYSFETSTTMKTLLSMFFSLHRLVACQYFPRLTLSLRKHESKCGQ